MDRREVTRFTSLWTQTQTAVLAFISANITSFVDAEDILQRVAEVAVNKFDQFDADGDSHSFTGWTIKIARFEILRFLRDSSSDRHQFVSDTIGVIADAFEQLVPEIDGRRHALAECIKGLDGRPKKVLNSRFGEGMKTGKIAEQLGLSPGNVSVILNRTYKTLKNCIEMKLATGGAHE